MGRAYDVRKASIQKTGAKKGKLYSLYSKEIYQAAKTGGVLVEANQTLKQLLERARKDQVPNDIINRALAKVNSDSSENYDIVRYEIFGPSSGTLIIDCLTDNVNRTLSHIRPVLNKNNLKMGVQGSVSYLYDYLAVLQFIGLDELETLDLMIEEKIDIIDLEVEDNIITVYTNPEDFYKTKEAISKKLKDVQFIVDEITFLPKSKVELNKEEQKLIINAIDLLEEVEDVQKIYHNLNI